MDTSEASVFIPFLLETTGRIGHAAKAFLRTISTNEDDQSPEVKQAVSDWKKHLKFKLACTIANYNYFMLDQFRNNCTHPSFNLPYQPSVILPRPSRISTLSCRKTPLRPPASRIDTTNIRIQHARQRMTSMSNQLPPPWAHDDQTPTHHLPRSQIQQLMPSPSSQPTPPLQEDDLDNDLDFDLKQAGVLISPTNTQDDHPTHAIADHAIISAQQTEALEALLLLHLHQQPGLPTSPSNRPPSMCIHPLPLGVDP